MKKGRKGMKNGNIRDMKLEKSEKTRRRKERKKGGKKKGRMEEQKESII